MNKTAFAVAFIAFALSAPTARAQEDWRERRGEGMRELGVECDRGNEEACERIKHIVRDLRINCDGGDEEACERLRRLSPEWREEHRRHEEREEFRRREEREDRDRGERVAPVDPKAALCLTIQRNYADCMRRQHDGCPAWVYELKANHCF